MDTLARHIETQGPLPVRDAIGWVLRAALTVWDLHVDGASHGRIHASTILIADVDCRSEGVLLSPLEVEDDERFHSIERAMDGKAGKLDDVWGLGVTLYYALTGKLPFPKGAAATREAGRRAPPLAMSVSALDVMQPVIDRFIGGDMAMASIDELVVGLQEFSPTIADLEALPLEGEMPPPPAPDPEDPGAPRSVRPESQRPSAAPAAVDRNLSIGLGVAGLAAVVVMGVIALRRGGEPAPTPPDVVTTSEASTATSRPSGATQAPSSTASSQGTALKPPPKTPPKAPSKAGPSPPSPVPAEPPPPAAPAPASAAPGGSDDMVACLADIFPDNAFAAGKPGSTFPCRERNPKELHRAITAALAAGSGGKASAAAKEWSNLGWYQVAAMEVARAHCCRSPPAFEVPPLLGVCAIEEALATVGRTTTSGNDTAVAKAIDGYRNAAHCALTAGGAGFFMQTQPPNKREAALFVRLVTRFRARQR